MSAMPLLRFDHLLRMTDERGTFEHALHDAPRPEHGYCTDDVARVLVVSAREPDPTREIADLAVRSLRFVRDAQAHDGRFRNRLNRDGHWEDLPSTDDCWGRAIWGLGTAAARLESATLRRSALVQFERAVQNRSPSRRAMAFAGLGAAEVLTVDPAHHGARRILGDAASAIPAYGVGDWLWPEPRLAYANAVLPELLLAAGDKLHRPRLIGRGIELLAWLLQHETADDGHLSVTPAGGAGPRSAARPSFAQQPIEVAALADACARAAALDSDERWDRGLRSAVAWFTGDNDGRHVMWDPATGGGFDGLEADGPNQNQGAESTLALLSTLQHARSLAAVAA